MAIANSGHPSEMGNICNALQSSGSSPVNALSAPATPRPPIQIDILSV
ncbi:unnamed protein product, partial [marine sediment metagenome]